MKPSQLPWRMIVGAILFFAGAVVIHGAFDASTMVSKPEQFVLGVGMVPATIEPSIDAMIEKILMALTGVGLLVSGSVFMAARR